MLPETWENVRRVLAIQVGSQGDLMLTIPALQKLRYLFSDAVITLMVSPSAKQLDSHRRWIDDVLVYEGGESKFKNNEYELALISNLRQYAFDVSVIFTNSGESPYTLAYICYLAGIPIRIGQSKEFGGSVLSHCVKPIRTQGDTESIVDIHTSDLYDPIGDHLFLLESAFK
ncbi:hypothetical protein [Fischerella sp. JS2]|uniref:glycosyltransferase family 9 protein n=1 Tax=Fischerella sp. JS2 TaxID=2597771 RepID=UPI0028EB3745|nr:hypothetical protein [Fischerella sp. JS2]